MTHNKYMKDISHNDQETIWDTKPSTNQLIFDYIIIHTEKIGAIV